MGAIRLAHFRFIMVEVRAKQHRSRPMARRRKIAQRRRHGCLSQGILLYKT